MRFGRSVIRAGFGSGRYVPVLSAMARRPMMVVTIAILRLAGSFLENTIEQICRAMD